VKFLSLEQALIIAAEVTGLPVETVARSARLDLLDSALVAPEASFGGQEFYQGFEAKAAVLCVRIAKNHPLLDGNKRLAWMCLRMFCELNSYRLTLTDDDAVEFMLEVAAGTIGVDEVTQWLHVRLSERGEGEQ
jgi:death-on-curing protein